ncbi:MAG: phospholipase A [Gammaproteobacteria bacterium]
MKAVLLSIMLLSSTAWAADEPSPPPAIPDHPIIAAPPAADPAPQAVQPAGTTPAAATSNGYLSDFHQDPDAYSITSVGKGLSTHRPMYVMPYTYSPAYDGRKTEVVFQISAKQRLFGTNFYAAYTQKSFWQAYNKKDSSPFYETDYNPELFYRWTPDPIKYNHWGADAGFEHESNGQDLPDSRSWNRIYIAPFWAKGKTLVYLKIWYRLPEKAKTGPTDASGDDNPDIQDYLGHFEFQIQRQFFDGHLAHLSVRDNPSTGKGSVMFNYSIPAHGGSFFYGLYMFNGYGDSLIDYNRSVTRVGLSMMLTR